MSVEAVKTSIATGLGTMAKAAEALQNEDDAAKTLAGRISLARTAIGGLMDELRSIQDAIDTGVVEPLSVAVDVYVESQDAIMGALEGADTSVPSNPAYNLGGLMMAAGLARSTAREASIIDTGCAIAGLASAHASLGNAERGVSYAAEVGRRTNADHNDLASRMQTYADGL